MSAPEPPPRNAEFYCYQCETTVSMPAPSPLSRPLCPRCRSDFIVEDPNPSPPRMPLPEPALLSGSDLDSDSDSADDFGLSMTAADAQAYFTHLINQRLIEGPINVTAAAAAAVSMFQEHTHRPGRGEPPAPAAAIAALPTVAVTDPTAVCAICKDDLPLASHARQLPCAHLYHSCCIVTWLELHNSCPVCRFRLPSVNEATPSEQDPDSTQITFRFTTAARGRIHMNRDGVLSLSVAAPMSASPTQLAQAFTAEGGVGPANSGETVSSEWPPHPESDTVMSEAREGDGFFD